MNLEEEGLASLSYSTPAVRRGEEREREGGRERKREREGGREGEREGEKKEGV